MGNVYFEIVFAFILSRWKFKILIIFYYLNSGGCYFNSKYLTFAGIENTKSR